MKRLDSAWWRYSLEHNDASITIQFENLIKSRIIILLSISGSVCVKLFYVSFHGADVAKFLPTDVASECLDACVLHQVTRHTVRRCKPATAYITVIGIETLVHLHMPSEACPVGESLSTLTTLMSQITRHWQLVLFHPPGIRRYCLEHKQASVRHLQGSVRHLLTSVRHLQASVWHSQQIHSKQPITTECPQSLHLGLAPRVSPPTPSARRYTPHVVCACTARNTSILRSDAQFT